MLETVFAYVKDNDNQYNLYGNLKTNENKFLIRHYNHPDQRYGVFQFDLVTVNRGRMTYQWSGGGLQKYGSLIDKSVQQCLTEFAQSSGLMQS